MLSSFINKTARLSAVLGGIVLTALAITMTISIIGGSIAKFANSDFLISHAPSFATWLQDTGIRTIPPMYELMEMGIAFVIFAFLPITTLMRGHAIVDIFTHFLPEKVNTFLNAFWETVFLVVLVLISWRMVLGTERLISTHALLVELHMPEWWGYAVACVQMGFASFVSLYVAINLWVSAFGGHSSLPKSEGALH